MSKLPELEICQTYCNEKQIFPAMRHFIEVLQMSVNSAAREVSKLTSGLVTQKRAEMVWNNRKVSSNEELQTEAAEQTEEIQDVATERYLVENPQENIIGLYKEIKKEEKEAQKKIQQEQTPEPLKELPTDKFRTIVVDPPWPVKKILRDVRPNQDIFDYSPLTIEQIKEIKIQDVAYENCHIYLWTTHKFLPDALSILDVWGFKYQCLLTWVKNVGMTPFSFMYSTEHCLFGRKGSLDLLKKGVRLDFTAKVREHSRKPEEFYNLVKAVSPGPRIDFFSREKREGFEQYGNETGRF